jgi:Do/DeqQ family serine protease
VKTLAVLLAALTLAPAAAAAASPPGAGAGALQNQLIAVVKRVEPSVVQIETSSGLGSGVVLDKQGHIVTNNHVVEGASKITVNFQDGSQHPARLVGVDPDSDLAVLRIDSKNLPTAVIGTSSDLMIGETVIAVGNPFGLSGTVTTGVVSALGRSVPSKERTFTDFIQTDASINPGNSGGPLLNIEGKVIGINTAIYAQAQGIGFAIPVDRAKKVVQDLLRYGAPHNGWIGAVTATITPEEAKRIGVRADRGAIVARVFSGSPAEAAGLREGDVITAVGDKPVDSREAFSTYTATVSSGQPVPVSIVRGNSTTSATIRPTDPPANLGLRILADVAGIQASARGRVVVDSVTRGSRAETVGITPGDIIVGVNAAPVQSLHDLNDQLQKSSERSSFILEIAHGGVIYELTFPMAI